MKKVRQFVKITKQSNPVHLAFQSSQPSNNKTALRLDFKIRWNTTYKMLERFREHRNNVTQLSNNPANIPNCSPAIAVKLARTSLTPDEWNLIDIAIKLLRPISKATDELQTRKFSMMATYKVIEKLLFAFYDKEISSSQCVSTRELSKHIREQLENYLCDKVSISQQSDSSVI